jgi:AcrR family transcriptional regulator
MLLTGQLLSGVNVAVKHINAATVPRWQRRPGERPEQILDAAQQVFGDCGFMRAKLDDVARVAGVSKGTLYRYFDSKETLFREMVRAKVVSGLAETEAMVKAHSGSSRDLLALLMEKMFHRLRDQDLVRITRVVQAEFASFPELAQFYFDEVIVRATGLFGYVLQRGAASGEFRQVSHGFGARALPSLLVHSAQVQSLFQQVDPGALPDEKVLEGLIDFSLSGVLARPDIHS